MIDPQQQCYHCGLAVPLQADYRIEIDGVWRFFCCPGCRAVAQAIVSGGLSSFYRFRSANNTRPEQQQDDFSAFDLAEIQSEFTHEVEPGVAQTNLLLQGISCAACVWLIERRLEALPGVCSVSVNATTHRCSVRWQPQQLALSRIMGELQQIGYHPMPATRIEAGALREEQNRRALMRLAVAGFGMMQVGMVAVALYAGADAGWEVLFRWLSLIIATPVVVFSAGPFFGAALRALQSRHLTMDVPVAIAIGTAFLASVWATVSGSGEVYFDSVSMFTFFLLLGRYLEMRARHRNGIDTDRYAQLLPLIAQRRGADDAWETVNLRQIRTGDRVLVGSGSCIPCDGIVLAGSGGVVETVLTGEPDAVHKSPGDSVTAGTLNTDSALQIEVTAVGAATRLSAIERMVEQAQHEKPVQVAMADRLASVFVAVVLVTAALVALVWWQLDPQRAFWITLSVLVVTCPCALSLASPTALTVATNWLRQRGLLITRGHVLEGLNQVDHVIFDKTGTLTVGSPRVVAVLDASLTPVADSDRQQLLAICAALEKGSSHPIARAFQEFEAGQERRAGIDLRDIEQITGRGVRGTLAEGEYAGTCFLGKPGYFIESAIVPHSQAQWLMLAVEPVAGERRVLAWIQLQDRLRDSALRLVQGLGQKGIDCELLSGDASGEVQRVAAELDIEAWQANCSPDDKLAHMRRLQQQGRRVLMVGDGINDVPVLSSAFVSVAMGDATDLAQTRADSVLLNGDLVVLLQALQCAQLTRRIIRQNLSWALCYNLLAVPLAAAGWVPPWAAAIGMSGSSLLVVGNALRIGRH